MTLLRRPVQGQESKLSKACEATPRNARRSASISYCRASVWVPKHHESNAYVVGAAVVTEVALIFDFSICVILRTLDTRRTLMHKDDLTKEDELLPTVLSSIMVLISAVIPLAILLYNRRPKPQEMETPHEVERS